MKQNDNTYLITYKNLYGDTCTLTEYAGNYNFNNYKTYKEWASNALYKHYGKASYKYEVIDVQKN